MSGSARLCNRCDFSLCRITKYDRFNTQTARFAQFRSKGKPRENQPVSGRHPVRDAGLCGGAAVIDLDAETQAAFDMLAELARNEVARMTDPVARIVLETRLREAEAQLLAELTAPDYGDED